jgi:hypothetical protein
MTRMMQPLAPNWPDAIVSEADVVIADGVVPVVTIDWLLGACMSARHP